MSQTVRRTVGIVAAGATTVGLVGLGVGSAAGAPHRPAALAKTPALTATISGKPKAPSLKLSGPTTFAAGRVALTVKAKNADHTVEVTSFKKDYSLKAFTKDINTFNAAGNGQPTKAELKALNRAVAGSTFYGGLEADKGKSISGTVFLPKKGTYYIYADNNGSPSSPVKLTVTGPSVKRVSPTSSGTITALTQERFHSTKHLKAHGTLTFKNTSTKSPHFLVLFHVKKGTTRKDVFNALTGASKPTFFLPGGLSTDVVSEGLSQTVSYKLPKGEYAEACFFPDLMTGVPHAFMGMIGITTLH